MQEHTQSIIARIQKLLALSQSSNEHEAAAALAQALGVSVKTIQRRLAAHRGQRTA
ncbi:MAG TPA: DUF2786 domain-containing protein [Ktedonobacteraceae bacterium]|jgi:predicted DNA-binding transcriptional regulator YafY|nr:DUF2786 domain-containing protein [Ktedonobacteraceae bacterium]